MNFQMGRCALPRNGAKGSFSQGSGSCPWSGRASCRSGNVGRTESKCADPQIEHIERAIFSYKDFSLNHIPCTISGFSEKNNTELIREKILFLKSWLVSVMNSHLRSCLATPEGHLAMVAEESFSASINNSVPKSWLVGWRVHVETRKSSIELPVTPL